MLSVQKGEEGRDREEGAYVFRLQECAIADKEHPGHCRCGDDKLDNHAMQHHAIGRSCTVFAHSSAIPHATL